MRRIPIDRARAKGRSKRGGSWKRVDLDPAQLVLDEAPAELLDLDEALQKLAAEEPNKAQARRAALLRGADDRGERISAATAVRHRTYACAWLYDSMTRGSNGI